MGRIICLFRRLLSKPAEIDYRLFGGKFPGAIFDNIECRAGSITFSNFIAGNFTGNTLISGEIADCVYHFGTRNVEISVITNESNLPGYVSQSLNDIVGKPWEWSLRTGFTAEYFFVFRIESKFFLQNLRGLMLFRSSLLHSHRLFR